MILKIGPNKNHKTHSIVETLDSQNDPKMKSQMVSRELLETVLYENTQNLNPYTMYYVTYRSATQTSKMCVDFCTKLDDKS